ncbi:MAG: type II toxin-antitoxin system death-on-curing family toxin [Deinococcota bacterium]
MSSPNSKTAFNYRYRGKDYPTLGFVVSVAESILNTSEVVLKTNELESALHAPVMTVGGEDAYPRFFDKVAALTYRIVTNHVFIDGNKRSGFLIAKASLEWNGYYLVSNQDTNVTMMSLLSAGHLDIAGLRHAFLLMCNYQPAHHPEV